MKRTLTYILFIVLVVGFGALSGISNMPGEWYQTLEKPFFQPPPWLFGPVWTTLYVLIAIAGAKTWLAAPASGRMQVWFAQMALNFLWSPAFFGAESSILGLIVIVPLLVAIILFIRMSWSPDRVSAWLFLPYLAWVGFATLLNLSIVLLN
ncbi:TspO/MBR family protein [Rhizobium halophilum]|uniref:TspO/MBR family protein n=1 Tax=Rhizobium halophilum TaxID=2846852 RepID=UPI001EFC3F52|nr:TspO/MBR family protein [Rhizobium halophilum]MCF6369321.1 tryptophan-rich sensory protein [Rhizobium halophilum]